MSTYSEKLRDPRWQKKRLEVMEAAGWKCQACGESRNNLQVHHAVYLRNVEPWDHNGLIVLCDVCHSEIEHLIFLLRLYFSGSSPKQWRAIKSALDVAMFSEIPSDHSDAELIRILDHVHQALQPHP